MSRWIAVDWGTTRLRAWAMEDDRAVAETRSDAGMAGLGRAAFEPALLGLAGGWIDGPTDVVICGMAGARQGWVEAPYRAVPCAPLGAGFAIPATRDPRLRVRVVPGLSQTTPPDVMRGEETQIAGVLAADPGFDGVLCLPGTHTKWVRISAGEVAGFVTLMTGEMFAALSRGTVLRHSLDHAWDDDAFAAALADGMARPEALGARLFRLRAADLLGVAVPAGPAALSGLLIGAELVATRGWWLGCEVGLVGRGPQTDAYARALQLQGVPLRRYDGEAAVRRGLAAAHAARTGKLPPEEMP